MMSETVTKARWFPEPAPALDGEDDDAYTNRLTGCLGEDLIPYDHRRNRQCSIVYHGECSDPAGKFCECPCHTETGKLEMRVWELEESVVCGYAIASGKLATSRAVRPGWPDRIIAGLAAEVAEIVAARPRLAEWYLARGKTPDA